MKKEKRIYRPQGNVNHSFIRHDKSSFERTLKNQKTGEIVEGCFYRSKTEWIGFTKSLYHLAPCKHCGQTGIFHKEYWTHQCPGFDKPGYCNLPHNCYGGTSFTWDWNPKIESYRPGGWNSRIYWRDDEGWEEKLKF